MLPGGWGCSAAPHLKPRTVCLGVLPIPSAAKAASRSPKGRTGGPEGPGLSLPGSARHLRGSPPDFGRLTHHGEAPVSGARGSRLLWRRQQLQQLELCRASAPPHSLPAARAAAAAARPNGPSTAAARAPPRPAPPQPARAFPLHCGSLRIPPRQDRAARPFHGVRLICRRARARARAPPRHEDYFRAPRSRPLASVPLASPAEGHGLTESDASLCEPRRYWPRLVAEMRAELRLARPSLQCVKLGRATARCAGGSTTCVALWSRGE